MPEASVVRSTPRHQFGATRLHQIARLASLERDHLGEFNETGLRMTRRAIFTMILDCQKAGSDPDAVRAALNGQGMRLTHLLRRAEREKSHSR